VWNLRSVFLLCRLTYNYKRKNDQIKKKKAVKVKNVVTYGKINKIIILILKKL